MQLSPEECRRAVDLSEAISRQVLRSAITAGALDADTDTSTHSRRIIHQATGVILAQVDISADDAQAILQAHAYAAGAPMKSIARQIVDGELRFVRTESGIEVVG